MADTKYDLNELVEGSVSSITEKFGELSSDDLAALHDLESGRKGEKRSTLLSAIQSEQEAREQTKKAQDLQAMAESEGVRLYTEAEMKAAQTDHEQRIAALEARLKETQAAVPAKAEPTQVRKLALTGDAEGPFQRVAFTGADDVTIAALPELRFGEGAFALDRTSGGVVLKEPISFPESTLRAEVSKVWLLGANGKAQAVAELVNPLAIGGGTKAKIPGGHLLFRGVPKKVEAQAA